jgi:hypothetical protein
MKASPTNKKKIKLIPSPAYRQALNRAGTGQAGARGGDSFVGSYFYDKGF